MNIWYLYRHIRHDKNEPFYIGIGCKKNYARAYETDINKRNNIWNRIINKTTYDIEIIFDNLTKEEASIKEKEFVKLYGRKDINTGCLANMTDGGDGIWGAVRSKETKEKLRIAKLGNKNPMFGKSPSKETLEKKRLAAIGLKRSKETKLKQSLASIKSGQAKPVLVYNYKTKEFIGEWYSISEACRELGNVKMNSKASLVAQGKENTLEIIYLSSKKL